MLKTRLATKRKTPDPMFSRKRKPKEQAAGSTDPQSVSHGKDQPLESSAEKPLTQRTLRMLGITVLLSQLPLLLHLPLWLTLPGIGLVFAKMRTGVQSKPLLPPTLTIIFVLLSVIAVFANYGYLFGRDPCVAFLFLLLSFKYIETKKNYDASLLIILCAFLLITQFFFRQSLISAILCIPAMYFVGLTLFVLQRGTAITDTRTMVHLTAKLFLQAMPIALILFVAVPRISHKPWNGNGNGQATTGLSSSMSPGSIASLSKSNEVAFRVEFDGQPPSPLQRYWRGPVLTGFDGYDWFVLPDNKTNNTATTEYNAGSVTTNNDSRQINYTVTMPANYQSWLLALDTPAARPELLNNKKLKVIVNNELQINTAKPVSQPLRYRASSLLSDQFQPSEAPDGTTLITARSNPQAREFAQQLRAKYSNDSQLVNSLLAWFNREPFYYTLNPPTLGKHSIDDFLFDSRRGFCEHYAGSFVFMLRAAGIPARVVTGYQGGKMNNGYMIVRQSDAHAWAEAYIDNKWQRFDPTAAVAPQRVELGAADALRNDISQNLIDKIEIPYLSAFASQAALKWDEMNFAWQRIVIGFDSDRQNALWNKIGIEKPSGWMIVVLLIAAALLWATIILKPLSGLSSKKLSPCKKYWRKLTTKLNHHGLIREQGETHADYIERACDKWPQHRTLLQSLMQSYNEGVYSANGSDPHRHRQIALEMKSAIAAIGRL